MKGENRGSRRQIKGTRAKEENQGLGRNQRCSSYLGVKIECLREKIKFEG